MKQNASDNDDQIDFSMIGTHEARKNDVDFSIEQLLAEDRHQKLEQSQNSAQEKGGSFLRDLAKIEKQISYDSVIYDIYDNQVSPVSQAATAQGKQESTCTRTLNQFQKGYNQLSDKRTQPYYNNLIISFKKEKDSHKKNTGKESPTTTDYFGLNRFCCCREISMHKKWRKQENQRPQFLTPYPRSRIPQRSKSKKKRIANYQNSCHRSKSIKSSQHSITRPFISSTEQIHKKKGNFKKLKKSRKKSSSRSYSSNKSQSNSQIKIRKQKIENFPQSNQSLAIQEYFGYDLVNPTKPSTPKYIQKNMDNSKIKIKTNKKSKKKLKK